MTKEKIFEELLAKRSAASQGSSNDDGSLDWQKTGGLNEEQLKIVSWTIAVVLSVLGFLTILAVILCICYCLKNKNKKKQHAFGIKKNYFKERVSKPARNPAPVTNPSKGHYLKKSPSPTGNKSPPGYPISSNNGTVVNDESIGTDEYAQRKPLIAQQTGELVGDIVDHTTEIVETLRRSSSSGQIVEPSDPSQVLGTLHCTIRYSFDKNALVVTVNRCENLPAKDSTAKSSDPYVKLQLLPEKQHKVKTRVMRRTLNPVYDEDFTFYGIHFSQMPALTLHFVVLSFDRYSRDDVIGEVMLDLEALDLSTSDSNPLPISREITPRSYKLKSQGRGEILVSLCYQPAANRITVVVLKARNLPKMDITGLSDPYVKIYLLYNDQRIAKKKTHVKKRTLNPVFNESFVFELPHLEEGLKNISLEFMLLDWDRVTKNEVIGRLELGGDKCEGTALHHWNEVLASPRRQIAEWHKLRE
jgi:hypothetical protein